MPQQNQKHMNSIDENSPTQKMTQLDAQETPDHSFLYPGAERLRTDSSHTQKSMELT